MTSLLATNGQVDGRPAYNLERFLRENIHTARERSAASGPVREEVFRLSKETVAELSLQDLRWECDWGSGHYRGSLESFRRLCQQHPDVAASIRGRTLHSRQNNGRLARRPHRAEHRGRAPQLAVAAAFAGPLRRLREAGTARRARPIGDAYAGFVSSTASLSRQ
ncbi:hypothetical protein HPB51_009122 [Rhipicephalus microplus]|uniref:DUF4461 domain-containing protein n=1 Tax=Rhipicephalus microplus TaxID=6941 RepID=A0A9J6EZH8_RHIMP|nr:hypothetical protein HPB51_009122 [Rhipicephalus microplus]